MTVSKGFHGRFTRRRRVKRLVAGGLVVIALVLAGGYWYLSRPERVGRLAGDLLTRMTGAKVAIASAHLQLNGTIDLRGVTLRVPGIKGRAGELFHAQQVLMTVDEWQALGGSFVAKKMILIEPTLSVTQLSDERYNYEVLQELRERQLREQQLDLPDLPRIFVKDGVLRYGAVQEERYKSSAIKRLSGTFAPTPQGVYDFELAQSPAPPAPDDPSAGDGEADPVTAAPPAPPAAPLSMHGHLDLKRLTVTWSISDLAFSRDHRYLLPREVRTWWDRCDPTGAMPEVTFTYDEEAGSRGTLRLEGVAITLPWLSSDRYTARMVNVSGVFEFSGQSVRVKDLVGQIEGEDNLRYTINAEFKGYTADAPFRVKLQTTPFQIPEQPRYMLALPEPVQKVFRMLNPVGWMRVSGELRRDEAGGELIYAGAAQILSGRELVRQLGEAGLLDKATNPDDARYVSRGYYHKFPYELTHCKGLLTFDRDAIEVKNLTGETGNGGSATINGTIGPADAGPDAAVDLTVTAVDIAFDDKLRAALPPNQQRALDLFFDAEAMHRLRDRGHFVSADRRARDIEYRDEIVLAIAEMDRQETPDPAALARLREQLADAEDNLLRSTFELGGRGNVVVRIERAPGPNIKPVVHTSIDLTDANVMVRYFPYPVRVRGGQITLSPTQAIFERVRLQAMRGGEGAFSGVIDLARENDADRRRAVPRLHLVANDLPFDELLYDVLPDGHSRWLRMMHIDGRFGVEGSITTDPDGSPALDMTIAFDDATATPGGRAFSLEALSGRIKLAMSRISIEKLAGRRGEATVSLTGEIDWADPQAPGVRLAAVADGLRFEDDLLDLISPVLREDSPLRALFEQRKPEGEFDAIASYSSRGPDHSDYQVVVKPSSLSFMHDERRIGLVNAQGSLVISPGRLDLHDLRGRFSEGELSMDGTVTLGDSPRAELSLHARGDRITDATRRAMPAAARRVVESIRLNGSYELDVSRLVLRPGATEGDAFSVDARVKLTGAAATIGLDITAMDATIDLTATAAHGADWPRIDVLFRGDKLLAAGRPVSELDVVLRNLEADDRFIVPKFTGRAAGGRIAGSGVVELASGEFDIEATLADAELAQLAAPDKSSPDRPADRTPGIVSASLALEGNLNHRKKLRGRGDLLVRDGDMHGLPLAVGLLRISHLALPVNDAFDTAQVSYFLQDRLIQLQRLQLRSESMLLDGRGTLELDSGAVDITMTTTNPQGLNLGPVTELIKKLRDQIVTVRITGTLDDPKTKIEQLSGLSNAVKDVLGGDGTQISE